MHVKKRPQYFCSVINVSGSRVLKFCNITSTEKLTKYHFKKKKIRGFLYFYYFYRGIMDISSGLTLRVLASTFLNFIHSLNVRKTLIKKPIESDSLVVI